MYIRLHRIVIAAGLLCLPGLADDFATPAGSFSGTLRYRYDLFDRQETAFPHTAEASTARLILGFATKQWKGFSGFAEMQGGTWFALFAPAGTPRPIIDWVNAEARKAFDPPDIRQRFVSQGASLPLGTPEALAAHTTAERVKWGDVIRRANIRLE